MRDNVKTRAAQMSLIEPQITGFLLTVHGSIGEITMQIHFHFNYHFKFI